VRVEDLPPEPSNRFLRRGSPLAVKEMEPSDRKSPPTLGKKPSAQRIAYESRIVYSASGRKIKGRGAIRYRSQSREGRSRSATPPHWRRELDRLKPITQVLAAATANQEQNKTRWLKGEQLDDEDEGKVKGHRQGDNDDRGRRQGRRDDLGEKMKSSKSLGDRFAGGGDLGEILEKDDRDVKKQKEKKHKKEKKNTEIGVTMMILLRDRLIVRVVLKEE